MKKLHRSKKHKVIAGVAGGLAEYFDIDPAIVRLLIAVFFLTGPFFVAIIFTYIFAWIFIPLQGEAPIA